MKSVRALLCFFAFWCVTFSGQAANEVAFDLGAFQTSNFISQNTPKVNAQSMVATFIPKTTLSSQIASESAAESVKRSEEILESQNSSVESDLFDLLNDGKLSEDASSELSPSQVKLFQDWDLKGTNLEKSELIRYFKDEEPAGIYFFEDGSDHFISSDKKNVSKLAVADLSSSSEDEDSAKYIFVSTNTFVNQIKSERDRNASQNASQNAQQKPGGVQDVPADNTSSEVLKQQIPTQPGPAKEKPADQRSQGNTPRQPARLNEDAFRVATFEPGFSDNKIDRIVPRFTDYFESLRALDYSLNQYDFNKPELVLEFNSRVISLGHKGLLVLEIDGGKLLDGPGFDFTIFENVFVRPERLGGVFQEFAKVGVSGSFYQSDVQWFECDPRSKKLLGCAGVVPSESGGDHFDLAALGISEARYIWIQDMGINKNTPGTGPNPWPTEGADIDTVRLIHAYE